MNTDLLDRPEVADEVVDTLPALATLRSTALAELSEFDRNMAKLRAEHGSTDYDIAAPFGFKLATTRRHAIRLVRYAVPKVVKAKRAELNEIRDAVASEGERIIAALQALEDPHDKLIQAEEDRRAAEKAEAERKAAELRAEADRIERERVERHQAGIAKIRGYLARCGEPGMTSVRINAGMAALQSLLVDESWEDFKDEASAAKEQTLAGMFEVYAATLAREEEAARLEAQRIENERVAAELAVQKAAIDAENEALRQRAAAFQAERDAARAAEEAEQARLVAEHAELERERIAELEAGAPKVGDDDDELVPAYGLVATPEGDRGPAHVDTYLPASTAAAPLNESAATVVRLGEISDRLGFTVTASLVSKLGIEPAGTEKRAILYRAQDWARICDALVAHINHCKGAF